MQFPQLTAINKIILGDNFDIMRVMPSESVDLIYLDPPFFSNRNYEIIWGDEGEIRSFKDRWSGGIEHYITWLKERVEQMYRVLKPTGSLFIHCDWHADAYIRVFILDKIFGEKNFINQIVWHYNTGGKGKKSFLKKHDTIFFYAKAKRSENIGRNVIDNFLSAAKRSDNKLFVKNQKEGKPVGVIIAFSFGKGAIQEAARLKLNDKIIIKIVTVEEIVPLAKKPAISVIVKEVSRNETEREIEFTTTVDSEAGIEFYSWDFSYNEKTFMPDILRDTKGQIRHNFKPGSYQIAVKVIDNEGLEGLEVFTLTLNGKIKRTK
jgi:hypothetical protein